MVCLKVTRRRKYTVRCSLISHVELLDARIPEDRGHILRLAQVPRELRASTEEKRPGQSGLDGSSS